jgi:hypothetical protein
MIGLRIRRDRRGDLELVYHGPAVTLLMPTLVARRYRLSRLVFIVDDENSRSASDGRLTAGAEGSTRSGDHGCGGLATPLDMGMAATTPSEAGSFECYDREDP